MFSFRFSVLYLFNVLSISKDMNCAELSDLEEGEILECDAIIPGESRGEHHVNGNDSCGYKNIKLKEKLKFIKNVGEKSNTSIADLESISSEEEYNSHEDEYSANDYYAGCKGGRKKRKQHSLQCYGTVEDIMSEIGETICRKSRCNYKKRKSKEIVKKSFDDFWSSKILSSHLKSKMQKKKMPLYCSDSDLAKVKTEKRKKRKRKDYEEEDEEKGTKKLKFRDFDEMRLTLLEKLKKQKSEEMLKSSHPPLERESLEIQEVDMLIDNTNCMNNPPKEVPENSASESKNFQEKDGEDDLDLVKLRLIALASNKKRKEVSPDISTPENPESASPEKKPENQREEVNLDRNELLLRAEALKTALLKKYKRRLNKLNIEKPDEMGNLDVNERENSSPQTQSEEPVKQLNDGIEKLDSDPQKENLKKNNETGIVCPSSCDIQRNTEEKKINETSIVTHGNSKKTYSRGKSKRKKKKPILSTNSLKENEKDETLEEDDRTLRTQLLSDLMKKKCLKDLEKKSVLMDSSQSIVNKTSPLGITTEPPMENLKPLPIIKKSFLKKVNVPRTTKPVSTPKFPKPDIQRIIVHLGSEDSSDEDVVSSQLTPECQTVQEQTTPQEKEIENTMKSCEVNNQQDEVIQANYEKSVELLLSQARKKIEGEKRTAASNFATPEAVYKHLPPSQRLEYLRLKQKIAERESQRSQMRENSTNSSAARRPNKKEIIERNSLSSTSGNINSKPSDSTNSILSKSMRSAKIVPGVAGVGGNKHSSRFVVNKIKNNSSEVQYLTQPKKDLNPETTGRSFLLPSSQTLISNLKLLLKKIKMEKMIEENYEREISKLKNQLNLFEKRKYSQVLKIKKLWEESMKTYKTIQGMTEKRKEKVTPKEKEREEGEKPKGEEEKEGRNEEEEEEEEEEGKNVSNEPETEICKAQSTSGKEVITDDKLNETVADVPPGPSLLKYDSPLEAFNQVSNLSERVDPNVMMCQFDLMGVCKDEDCAYQHLRILAK